MSPCPHCSKCESTACTCPAKVAKAKPLGGGNFWLLEPEPEPPNWWPAILMAANVGLVCGVGYGALRYFFN